MAAAELVIVTRQLLMLQQSLQRIEKTKIHKKNYVIPHLSVLEFSLTHLAFGFVFDFLQRFCLQLFLILSIFYLTTNANISPSCKYVILKKILSAHNPFGGTHPWLQFDNHPPSF